jgi:hypothetical protein
VVTYGDERFLARIERKIGRTLKPGNRGPKPSALVTAIHKWCAK